MFSIFNPLQRRPYGLAYWLGSRVFRFMFGMIFIYVGINLAGDLVRNKAGSNTAIKDLVYKYDAAEIAESLTSDVGNAIASSFESNGQPTTLKGANQQAKSIASSLEQRFRDKLPAAFGVVEDSTKVIATSFHEAINATAAKSKK